MQCFLSGRLFNTLLRDFPGNYVKVGDEEVLGHMQEVESTFQSKHPEMWERASLSQLDRLFAPFCSSSETTDAAAAAAACLQVAEEE